MEEVLHFGTPSVGGFLYIFRLFGIADDKEQEK